MSKYTQLQIHINNKLWKQLGHLVKKHIFHFIAPLKSPNLNVCVELYCESSLL